MAPDQDFETLVYPHEDFLQQRIWLAFREFRYEPIEGELTRKKTEGRWVFLYMPGAPELTDSVTYNSEGMGISGALTAAGIRRGVDNAEESMALLGRAGVQSLADVAALVGLKSTDRAIIAKVLQQTRTTNTPIGQGVRSALRVTANPHVKSLFNGVNLREFSFTFEFIPKSEKESVQVEKIIKFFRAQVYPETIGVLDSAELSQGDREIEGVFNSLAYNFPNTFEIQMAYMKVDANGRMTDLISTRPDGTTFGHKYKECHLKSVAVSYDSGSAMTIHPDGRFVAATMTLAFEEEETLSKIDVLQGGY